VGAQYLPRSYSGSLIEEREPCVDTKQVSESWELFLLPFSSQVQWKVDETSILYLTFPWAEMVSQRNFDLACQKTLSDAQCQDIRAFQVLLSQLLLICDGKLHETLSHL
jgi:hypothetical protein